MSDKITYWFKTGILFLTSASFASEDQKKDVVTRFKRSNCSIIINDSKPTQQQSITSEVVKKACLNNNVPKQDDLASFEVFLDECVSNASSVFKKESSITIEQIQCVEQSPLSLFSSKKNPARNSKQMVLMPVTIAKSYGKSVEAIEKKIKEHCNELSRLKKYLTVVQSPTYVPFFLSGYDDENYIERIKSTLIRGLKKNITSLNDSINVWTVLLDFARNSDEAI